MFEAQGKEDRAGTLLAAADRRDGRPALPPPAAQTEPPAAAPVGPLMLAAAPSAAPAVEPSAAPTAAPAGAPPEIRRVDVRHHAAVAATGFKTELPPTAAPTGDVSPPARPLSIAAVHTGEPIEPAPQLVAAAPADPADASWTLADAFIGDPAGADPVEIAAETVEVEPALATLAAAGAVETVDGPDGQPLALFPDDLFAAADLAALRDPDETDGWDAVAAADLAFAPSPDRVDKVPEENAADPAPTVLPVEIDPAPVAIAAAGFAALPDSFEPASEIEPPAAESVGRATFEDAPPKTTVRPVAASAAADRPSRVVTAAVEAPVILFPEMKSAAPPAGRSSVE